ncbi:unnamed protein product [Paramecium sonneborni]|uniref:Uncharacterized protein n=1 Tax=Paramecium sonneborni TaxID=65129 RepID=A0A8S1Q476_9CILI|nr:unnamed protein product [Paramecium sonneborni]
MNGNKKIQNVRNNSNLFLIGMQQIFSQLINELLQYSGYFKQVDTRTNKTSISQFSKATSSCKLSLYVQDKNPDSAQFRIISEAYRILSNPDLRFQYDQIQTQMERQFSLYNMIRNFINGKQERIELHNDTNTKDTEFIGDESKNREVTQIQKKKIRKNYH